MSRKVWVLGGRDEPYEDLEGLATVNRAGRACCLLRRAPRQHGRACGGNVVAPPSRVGVRAGAAAEGRLLRQT